MATGLLMRHQPRVPVLCPVMYLSSRVAGTGMVRDLSPEGMRVEGTQAVPGGMSVAVRVSLPDQEVPLDIPCTVVRWANGHQFGLQFHDLPPQAEVRLSQFLAVSVADLRVDG